MWLSENHELDRVFVLQRANKWNLRASGAEQRIVRLQRLRDSLAKHADEVNEVLRQDLRRPPEFPISFEAAVVQADLDATIAALPGWMQPVTVQPASLLPNASEITPYLTEFIQYESRGVTLIFGSWNAPFMLLMQPLIAAIAAGNTAMVKPNELAPASSALVSTIIRESCDEADVAVFEGGIDLANQMLTLPVDHIFFTGSPAVARTVAAAAATHLASTTLELGGKSPALVDGTTDLKATAAVIASGKFFNAGQICITPDHVWVHESVRDEFAGHYMTWVEDHLYTDGQLDAAKLPAMVNLRNYNRVIGYLRDAVERGATLLGTGGSDQETLTIEPGVLIDVPIDAAIMQNEIFGPLLPLLTFTKLDDFIEHMRSTETPLAMYPFSTDDAAVARILSETTSGGVTVNGWSTHAFDFALPFGGVGNSGSGHYRGVYGFRELSHARAVTRFPAPFDPVSASR